MTKPETFITKFWLAFFAVLMGCAVSAQVVKGTVTDEAGFPLVFASVYIENSTLGVSTDLKGRYFFEIPSGQQQITFSFLGFEPQTQTINLNTGEIKTLNVRLEQSSNALAQVEVVADVRDRGTEIMKQAIDRRSYFRDAVSGFRAETYVKTSLEKAKVGVDDSLSVSDEEIKAANLSEYFARESMNLIEAVSITSFQRPENVHVEVIAYNDFSKGNADTDINRQGSVTFSADIGHDYGDIAPKRYNRDNPYLLYEDMTNSTLDFYRNYIDFPRVTQQPLLSPIASTATLNYKFYFVRTFVHDGKRVHEIKVEPRNPTEALFVGKVFIQDESFALLGVDLRINKAALAFCRQYNIIQNYEERGADRFVPVRCEMNYIIREGGDFIIGSTRIDYDDISVNPDFDRKVFGSEIKAYSVEAFNRDSTFWKDRRPLTLSESELDYIRRSDSIADYFESDEYLRKLDSAFNIVDWWTPLEGYGRRNRAKGNELYIEGILSQINPFGIGGYRHRLPGRFIKTLESGKQISTEGFVDYGFRNRDVKARVTGSFTYKPEKFVTTNVTVGDYYDLINNYASIEQTFSRSNYIRNRMIGVSQRMEIVNGFYGELGFEYSDQKAITGLELSRWSNEIFGELNDPVPFERYLKSQITLKLKYRFDQEYIMRGKQKIVIGSDYPELNLEYRKGLPGLFGSEVNFDYLELNVYDHIQLARMGYSQWSAGIGTYLNKANLRVLEHKYFRGSDRFFFSNPVYSLQLLGPTLHTPNEWFQANYIHHFQGSLLGKVPLINRLKLELAGGGGILMIPDSDFAHAEVFLGLERVVKIKQQLFRFSAWAVTSDSSFEDPTFTFKFGIGFYNSFTQRWEY